MNEQNSKTAATETTRTWVNGPVISQYARYRMSLIASIATFEGDLMAHGARLRAGVPVAAFAQSLADQADITASQIKSLECTGGITSEFVYELVTSVIRLAVEYLSCGGEELKKLALPPFKECQAQAIVVRDSSPALESRCCNTFRVLVEGVAKYYSSKNGEYEALEDRKIGVSHDLYGALELYRTAFENGIWDEGDEASAKEFRKRAELEFSPDVLVIWDGYHRVVYMGEVSGRHSYPSQTDEAWCGNEGVARAVAAYGLAHD